MATINKKELKTQSFYDRWYNIVSEDIVQHMRDT